MKWSHVDLAEKSWTVPDTKMGRPHVVPLSDAAMAVLGQMQRYRDPATDCRVPGRGARHRDLRRHAALSDPDMGYKARDHARVQSTFKTWAEEVRNFDTLVIEAALAHAKKGMAAPYHRGAISTSAGG